MDGAPGLYSRRWAVREGVVAEPSDAANNRLLLKRLSGATDRSAQYVCAVALVGANHPPQVSRTTVSGSIVFEPFGDGGFAYDSLFWPDDAQHVMRLNVHGQAPNVDLVVKFEGVA